MMTHKLQAVVYDVPPALTTAITAWLRHPISLEKLSANRQISVGAQIAVSL